ncbi:hypothetical protein AWC17_25015 [Mycobacterium nebraskense]|uniref:Uncharacterized protein n=1 Tax=Mycobacterium nebraskense TaxID=244292 RepID=A0A1X2A000_9MYCO|nr:hypothetical protein AWC17_25015 [Mycobacterium nebraskense]
MLATSSAPRLIKPEATLLISAWKSLIDAASNWAARPASPLSPTHDPPSKTLFTSWRIVVALPSCSLNSSADWSAAVFKAVSESSGQTYG